MRTEWHQIPEKNLLIEIVSGDVTLEGLVEMKREEQRRGYLHPNLDILCILTDIELKLGPEDIRRFAEWLEDHLPRDPEASSALLVPAPVATALAMLFAHVTRDLRGAKVFTTVEGALAFLQVDFEEIAAVWPGVRKLNLR